MPLWESARSCAPIACIPGFAAVLACGARTTGASLGMNEPSDATMLAFSDAAAILHSSDGGPPACALCRDGADTDMTVGVLTDADTTDDAIDAAAPDMAMSDGPAGLGDQDAEAGPSIDDLCHVVWPQPPNLNPSVFFQIAVDAAGNAYLAISYAGELVMTPPPALDLGVANSPSYPTGVAIAKVDSACRLLWMREIGTSDPSSNVQNFDIAVDAQSNVIILGLFNGAVDFSGTTLHSPDAGNVFSLAFPYLMRFDASGQVVFTQVLRPTSGYEEPNPEALAVAADGTSTVVINENNLAAFFDGATDYHAQYLQQFDPTGRTVFQGSPSTAGLWVSAGNLFPDPAGGLWALALTMAGSGAPYLPAVVFHLTSTGGVTWSHSLDPSLQNTLFAAGAGGAIVFDWEGAGYSGQPARETLLSYLPDGSSPWTEVSTEPAFAYASFAQQMVIDANGNAIVGGQFFGTIETSADGSMTTSPTPSGIGFQAFDATGHFRHVKTWNGAPTDSSTFGAVAVDMQGNVLLTGTEGAGRTVASVFLAKLAQ